MFMKVAAIRPPAVLYLGMKPDRIARMIEHELSRAKGDEILPCLHSAERLIRVCMSAPDTAQDLNQFQELLRGVQARIRKHSH